MMQMENDLYTILSVELLRRQSKKKEKRKEANIDDSVNGNSGDGRIGGDNDNNDHSSLTAGV